MDEYAVDEVIDRLKEAFQVANYPDLAPKLGVSPRTIQTWKRRGAIPDKNILEVCKRYGINKQWLLYGEGQAPSPALATIPVLSETASAGGGSNIEGVDSYESGRTLSIDRELFGNVDPAKVRAVEVEGYSMVPVLLPGSWVFFREGREWSGDGLYVLIFRGVLMVKQVEADPKTGNLWIKSANRDYESWEYDPTEDQSTMRIVGRVVRVMM